MHVVVIGNGIAGINVASALLSAGGVSVDVYAAEKHPFYSRVRLPEVLAGAQPPEAIEFYKSEWYDKKGMRVHVGQRVETIDRAARTMRLADGSSVSYDYLVFATGASCNRPPIPGSELAGVYTMRTLEDVASIRASVARHPATASVVGGGLLGLEAARALKDSGVALVRVFEIAPRLLPRQLDETGAALLEKRFASMGIAVVCGAETARFLPASDDPARAGSIELRDGRSFPTDTTILSMGVRSNVELAKSCGLTVNRGIVVDSRLCAGDPRVFAVGDCAEFEGVVWGIIPAALEQASVAAKSILSDAGVIAAGEAVRYVQTVPRTALKVGDVELMSFGKAVLTPEEQESGQYEVLSRIDENFGRYEKFVLAAAPEGSLSSDAQQLAGAILYGSKAHQGKVQKMAGNLVTRAGVEELLADF